MSLEQVVVYRVFCDECRLELAPYFHFVGPVGAMKAARTAKWAVSDDETGFLCPACTASNAVFLQEVGGWIVPTAETRAP